MNRRDILRAVVAAAVLPLARATSAAGTPARIVFLNPGEAAEQGTGPMWRTSAQFMTAAAEKLGLALEILYAGRDHLLMLRQAEEVARRDPAPDYVVIVNEKMAGLQMLEILARSTAKVLIIHNDLTTEQRARIGNERERMKNWIGTATGNDEAGGYRLMETLYRRLEGREARIVGISGDPTTPVSHARAQGIADYVAHAGRGRIAQVVFGNWSYASGEEKARVLLARYPDTNLIWAANDSMALGALRAVKASGSGALVAGMGGWLEALQSVAAGELAATAAGQYLIGAWAMVLLYDYHHGHDFALHGGPRQRLDYLHVVDRSSAAAYAEAAFTRRSQLDFGIYSQARHPRPGPYDSNAERLLATAKSA